MRRRQIFMSHRQIFMRRRQIFMSRRDGERRTANVDVDVVVEPDGRAVFFVSTVTETVNVDVDVGVETRL